MLEDYFHIEGEMLRYLPLPKTKKEHATWFNTVHLKLEEFHKQGKQPRDYVLVELKSIDKDTQQTETKLVWRKK